MPPNAHESLEESLAVSAGINPHRSRMTHYGSQQQEDGEERFVEACKIKGRDLAEEPQVPGQGEPVAPDR
jgi:hypothetical protein